MSDKDNNMRRRRRLAVLKQQAHPEFLATITPVICASKGCHNQVAEGYDICDQCDIWLHPDPEPV
jgi:hypothetical protein